MERLWLRWLLVLRVFQRLQRGINSLHSQLLPFQRWPDVKHKEWLAEVDSEV